MKLQLMAVVLATACSSSPSSSGGTVAITGSLDTVSLAGMDNALAAVVTTSKGAGLDILLTEGADCAAVGAGDTADATYFELFLSAVDANGNFVAPTGPATFDEDPSSAGPYVEADVEALGSDCAQTTAAQFATGTVTVTALQGGVATGSVDLVSGSDHATGTFTTTACSGVATRAAGSGTPACH